MAVCNFKVKTISDKQLLFWYRGNICPNLMTLRELGNGIDFCLGLDFLFPGVIGNRVLEINETADYFKRINFRLLCTALNKLNVKIEIPVDGLLNGSFKDMFTFGSWFKAFFQANCKSQPDDLHKLRSFHLSRLAKQKKLYHIHKSDSHAKDIKSLRTNVSEITLKTDSSNACSESNVVLNTELSEAETERISVEENKQIIWNKNVPLGITGKIGTESFIGENKTFETLKVDDLSKLNIPSLVKEITEDIDANLKTDVDKTKTVSVENKDLSTSLLTDSPSYIKDPSLKKIIRSAIFSEQTQLEQSKCNSRVVTEEVLNDVKTALAHMKLVSATDDSNADRVCAIKNVANALEKLTTISHVEIQ